MPDYLFIKLEVERERLWDWEQMDYDILKI